MLNKLKFQNYFNELQRQTPSESDTGKSSEREETTERKLDHRQCNDLPLNKSIFSPTKTINATDNKEKYVISHPKPYPGVEKYKTERDMIGTFIFTLQKRLKIFNVIACMYCVISLGLSLAIVIAIPLIYNIGGQFLIWMMAEIFIDFYIMLLTFSNKSTEELENIRTQKRKIITAIIGLILMFAFIIFCICKESIIDIAVYSFSHNSNAEPEDDIYTIYCYRSMLYALTGCIFRSFNLSFIVALSILIYNRQKRFHILDTLYISQDNIYHL